MASLGMQGAGALTSAVGAYYGAKVQKSNLAAQADMADLNARMAETGAEMELMRGQRMEQGAMLRTAQIKSSQRASMAANGVDLGSDTAVNVLTSTDTMGQIDANTIAANAVRSAWGYRTQATNYQNQALIQRASANSINPGMSAMSSLLGSAGQVASSWYAMNKVGALTSDVANANRTDDPIGALGSSRKWWG
jgi:hypothetical protein